MNAIQMKQYMANNAWYGENVRYTDADRPRLMDVLIQPDYTKIWGIDISHWDGVVDLGKTKSLGCSFVFIKGIDGTIQSKYFVENYLKSVDVGLPRSSYGWLYKNANVLCAAQAQAFDALMQKYPPSAGLPPVIDFEWTRYGGVQSNPDYSDLRKWAVEWLRLGNQKALLYSAAGYMNDLGQIPADLKDMFAGLWIANYGVSKPALPFGWTQWKFWQFASNGDALLLAPGSTNKQELDLNYSALQVTDPPPPAGGTMKGTVLLTANIRDAANAIVGKVYKGDVVYGEVKTAFGLQRLFFTVVYRVSGGVEVWSEGSNVAVKTVDGVVILTLTDEVPPAPPAPPDTLDINVDVVVNVEGYFPKTISVSGSLEKL